MAIAGFRPIAFGTRLAKTDWAIGIAGLAIFTPSITTAADLVESTLSRRQRESRILFRLDTPKTLLHIELDALLNYLLDIWCNGSSIRLSEFMDSQVLFSGILSSNEVQDPENTKLVFRDQLIWESLMDEFLSMGLSNAKQAILSGCSADVLATLIHCDSFREKLPNNASVKCLYDAGFFLDEKTKKAGLFINSCYIHRQTWMGETWHSPNSPRINNKTIAESVGDWYFNRKAAKLMDCTYPCNPTCYNMDFTKNGWCLLQ